LNGIGRACPPPNARAGCIFGQLLAGAGDVCIITYDGAHFFVASVSRPSRLQRPFGEGYVTGRKSLLRRHTAMNWESFKLQFEALVSGAVTLGVFLASPTIAEAVGWRVSQVLGTVAGGTFRDVVATVFFMSAAYVTGALVTVVAGCVVESLNGPLVRPLVFHLLDAKHFPKRDAEGVAGEYRPTYQRALAEGGESAVLDLRARRERARIIRTSVVPIAILAWLMGGSWGWWGVLVSEVVAIPVVLFLFAVSQLSLYQEARRIVDAIEDAGRRKQPGEPAAGGET
jgi:hypothetical protein